MAIFRQWIAEHAHLSVQDRNILEAPFLHDAAEIMQTSNALPPSITLWWMHGNSISPQEIEGYGFPDMEIVLLVQLYGGMGALSWGKILHLNNSLFFPDTS